jgi:hypothetical protein
MSPPSGAGSPSPSNTSGSAPERYQVVPYNKNDLVAFFNSRAFKALDGYIADKPQIRYLERYCDERKVRTLLFEKEYLDRHFSEDFSGYYVRCFGGYQKKCSRLHLFSSMLSNDDLQQVLTGIRTNTKGSWADEFGYRGFIVIKPLPETVVGRTCVTPPEDTTTHFPTLRRQTANLFGIDLNIQSLPFQEQDHEVAACATSALWSVLHGTARLFDHAILSPLEITKTAQEKIPWFGRALPNDGLDMYQMAGVIRHLGLEAEILDASQKFLLQSYAYAYLRGGVPVLLGIDFNLDPDKPAELHAVALTGYEMKAKEPTPVTDAKFRSVATRINRFFAHDDGVGPFASLDLMSRGNNVLTSWETGGHRMQARPDQILVPLYSQIRTPYIDILQGIIEFDSVLEILRKPPSPIPLGGRLEWDIYLVSVGDLKRDIIQDKAIASDEKNNIATLSLPRFLWRAVGAVGRRRKLDLLFDATDLRQGRQLVDTICYDSKLERALSVEFASASYVSLLQHKITQVILNHYASQT